MFGTKQDIKWDVMGEVKMDFSIITGTDGRRTFRVEVTKPNGDIEVVSDRTFTDAMEMMSEVARDCFEDLWANLLDAECAEAEAELDDENNDEAELAFQSMFGNVNEMLSGLTVRSTSPVEAL